MEPPFELLNELYQHISALLKLPLLLCVCVCVCIYVCMYVCMCVYIYIYIYIYIYDGSQSTFLSSRGPQCFSASETLSGNKSFH